MGKKFTSLKTVFLSQGYPVRPSLVEFEGTTVNLNEEAFQILDLLLMRFPLEGIQLYIIVTRDYGGVLVHRYIASIHLNIHSSCV